MEQVVSNLPFYSFFAFLPSILWLNFYLKEDKRPEPKLLVLKVFILGMLITIPTLFLEIFATRILKEFNVPLIFRVFLGVALVEEILKFLVVKGFIFENPELDEPVDAMIYMIVAGLGFAAIENLFFIFSNFSQKFNVLALGMFSILRFASGTFLHALSSAIVGFFIGLSFFRKKERVKLIFFGISLATLLHGIYNFFIIKIKVGPLLSFSLIFLAAIFVSLGFEKLKE